MLLTCVRHGESSENLILHQQAAIQLHRANAPLTEVGMAQAAVTAKYLCSTLPDQPVMIWTSQLERAINTTAPLLGALREAGIPFDYQERADLNEKQESRVGVKDDESLAEFIPRVAEFAKRLPTEGHLIIVGHSVFISVLTSLLTSDQPIQDLVYGNPNCAITVLRDGQLAIQGSVDHLPLELQTGVKFR